MFNQIEEFPRYNYQEDKTFVGPYGYILDIENDIIEEEEVYQNNGIV